MKTKALCLYKGGVIKESQIDWHAMVAQKRVAIYARVSTLEKGQDPQTPLVALRAYAEHRSFVTVGEYVEYARFQRI